MNDRYSEQIKIRKAIYYTLSFVAVLWIIKFIETATDIHWYFLGIYPRTLKGLVGIVTSPLIHSDFLHLMSNTIPLLLLGTAFYYFYEKRAFEIYVWLQLTTNIWIWVFARDAYHVGASGIVYGLASFLFFSGIIGKDRSMMGVSGSVLILYGGMLYGVFPEYVDKNVSWEAHLMGLLAGLLLAFYFRKTHRDNTNEEISEDPEDQNNVSTTGDGIYQYHYKPENQVKKNN